MAALRFASYMLAMFNVVGILSLIVVSNVAAYIEETTAGVKVSWGSIIAYALISTVICVLIYAIRSRAYRAKIWRAALARAQEWKLLVANICLFIAVGLFAAMYRAGSGSGVVLVPFILVSAWLYISNLVPLAMAVSETASKE